MSLYEKRKTKHNIIANYGLVDNGKFHKFSSNESKHWYFIGEPPLAKAYYNGE